jgi:hypothetical protein
LGRPWKSVPEGPGRVLQRGTLRQVMRKPSSSLRPKVLRQCCRFQSSGSMTMRPDLLTNFFLALPTPSGQVLLPVSEKMNEV